MSSNDFKMEEFFECTQCGECCNGYGGNFTDNLKIRDIAQFIGLSVDDFKDSFLSLSSDGRYMLAVKEDGNCVFFDKNCSIHPVKPRMCREWPFLPAVLKERSNWELMSSACPGIKTDINYEGLKKFILKYLEKTRSKEEISKLEINW